MGALIGYSQQVSPNCCVIVNYEMKKNIKHNPLLHYCFTMNRRPGKAQHANSFSTLKSRNVSEHMKGKSERG